MDGYNAEVGKRIRNARKTKKLSMKKLGELVNLHESTISRYEKGEIQALDVDKLKEFADVLGVSPIYLMGMETEKEHMTKKERGKQLTELRNKKGLTLGELSIVTEIPIKELSLLVAPPTRTLETFL